jgi:hypothetical protein
MFKKLIVTGAAAALFLGSAAGAFATYNPFDFGTSASLTIGNTGSVSNVVNTSANTGYNSQIAKGDVESSSITTGAASAGSNVIVGLNQNAFNCGCVLGLSGVDHLTLGLTNNGSVSNVVNTSANTGYNSQNASGYGWFGGEVEHSSILTGAASASSLVQSVVNLNTFGTTP